MFVPCGMIMTTEQFRVRKIENQPVLLEENIRVGHPQMMTHLLWILALVLYETRSIATKGGHMQHDEHKGR